MLGQTSSLLGMLSGLRYAEGRAIVVEPAELDQLMARLAEGDRAAFAPLFRELWPRLRALCASLLKNHQDADDAAQRAMEKVLTRASDYDRSRSALPWAFAIAAWECRTIARARQRRREVSAEPGHELSAHTAVGADPEHELLQGELERAALAAMTELSERDRSAVVAAFWEEAKAGDPSARKRRQRAIERLRLAFRRIHGSD